jgi:hypothetical protein
MKNISALEAERVCGYRLDRRRKYAITEDGKPDPTCNTVIFELCRYSHYCTGCTEFGDYGTIYGPFGCEECGFTGRRRYEVWVPCLRSIGSEVDQMNP